MATIRTAKGTNSSKDSGSTLTVSAVNAKRGSLLFVGVAYETSQGFPTAKWGNGDLVRLDFQHNVGAAGVALFSRIRVRNPVARDVVVTWPGAILARAMFVTMIEGVNLKEQVKNRAQDATTTPDSGLTGTLSTTGQTKLAAFCAAGPSSDTQGTPTSPTLAGQRIGTTGAPPSSNVTIEEYFELDIATTAAVKARVTGAASRDWAISLTTIEEWGEISVLSDTGEVRILTAMELGAIEDSVLTWGQTAANQTTVKTWFPSTKQDIDIQAMIDVAGLAFRRIRRNV